MPSGMCARSSRTPTAEPARPLATPPSGASITSCAPPSTMAIPIGVVASDGDQPRNEIDVPSASHLRIEAHPQPRVFTLVWTITP